MQQEFLLWIPTCMCLLGRTMTFISSPVAPWPLSPRLTVCAAWAEDQPWRGSGRVYHVCPQLVSLSLSFLDSQTLFPLAGSLQSRAVDWQNIGHYGKDEGLLIPGAGSLSRLAHLLHASYCPVFSPHSSPPFPTPGWILRPFYNLLDEAVTEPGQFPRGLLVDIQ